MSRVFFSFFFLSFAALTEAQTVLSPDELKYFNAAQDSMCVLVRQSITAKDDADKLEINASFLKLVDEALNTDRSWAFPFDSLRKFRMLISSEDNQLNIITWNIPMDDKTQRYFGYIQHMDPATKKWQLFHLQDRSEEIRNPEASSLGPDKWFGAYYYKIVEKAYKKKKYYTLLGWDGNDRITQKKLIDVLTFSPSGDPLFSEGNFEVHKFVGKTDKEMVVWQKRVIFEFKQGVTMSLKFEPGMDLIIYDHLSPEESNQRGQYQYYGPDLSLDAYRFKKGKWLYIKDPSGRNKKSKQDKDYNSPTRDPNAPRQ